MLSVEAVEEFKRLYLKEYRVKLTNEHANNLGSKLIRLVKVVYGTNLPKKWTPKVDRSNHKELGLK